MSRNFNYVGQTFPIHDAPQKVTGELVYLNDMLLPNMVYAKLLLSPIAHGLIRKIDTSRAEALPGVIKVFTFLNTPNKTYSRYRIIPDQNFCPEDERLFTEKVRFVGDRVAAVVASSLEIAAEAISLIQVDYEVLPVLITPEEALLDEQTKIHTVGNLIHQFNYEFGERTLLLQKDWLVVETSTRTQKVHHAALETHGCIADFDRSGKLTLWAACQGVFGVRTIVADLLELRYNQVRVIKVPMGGSFGGRQEAILEPVTAFIAKEVKRPVKLIFNRKESIIATMTRPATSTRIQTSVTQDGILKECTVENVFDAGAYATSSVDNAYAMSQKIGRLYRIPYYSHQSKIVYTNTPVAGGARGWGAPEIITAMELHMDAVAKKLSIDLLEFRLKNLIHPYDKDQSHISLGNARVRECLEKGAAAFDWRNRYLREPDKGRYRRNVGMACAAHKNGMYGGFPEHSTMTLKMNEDGSFILNTGLHDVGCGTLTSIQQIAAEVLEVPPSNITVLEADTESSPYDFGSYGSRVTYVCGACAFEAATLVKEKLLDSASRILQKPKQYLELENGYVRMIGRVQQKLSYRDLATTAKVKDNTDIVVTHTYHGTSNPGAYGVHFAEVEVDTETGMVRVTDYLAVHDIGKAINPGMVEGQIEGSVQNGIGYALYEELKIDRDGNVLNSNFKNYHPVNAPDMPVVKTLLIEQGGDEGPFGAKSIGEIAFVPVAAAVINAVNNALGTSLTDMPLTPEKILAALKSR